MINTTSISHIVSSLNVGGAERFVIDLCRAQQKLGMSPSIISLGTYNDPLVIEAKEQRIPLTVLEGYKASKRVRTLLSVRKQGVIHIHSPHTLKFMLLMLPVLRKKKIVYTRHGAAPFNDRKWILSHKRAAPYISAISFVSKEGSEVFHQNHNWQKTPSFIIDNGVNLDQMNTVPVNMESGRIRLGSVGRMVELKNQIGLLQAIELINISERKGIEVHFFGDGECAGKLKEFHRTKLPEVKVIFHGMIRDRDKIYNSIDALIVTSETEGLSIAIIEAMAYKRAVIATNVGGNPRLIEDNVNGWLVPYDDSKNLAERINGFSIWG